LKGNEGIYTCAICKDFQLGKLSLQEAYNNLREVYNEENEHTMEVWIMLIEAERNANELP